MSLPTGTTFLLVCAQGIHMLLLAAAAATRAEPRVHFAREQGERMIAVSFKCRCQILRRLTKGTVLSFLFARGVCVCIPEPQPNGFTFKYDCLLQFIVGQQRTRGNLCRSLCEVDSQVCASCRSFLPGFLLKLGKKTKKNYCDFFFFYNDFIPC